jgi:alpha,alpha-trehalose phosphorylase
VIAGCTFTVEPWRVRETQLDLDVLAQAESVFALSNGHIGLRGNLDEGEPYAIPGTYLNSFHELRPLPYAEAGYGYPESGQTVVDVTNGKLIRLLVDDEPFDVRYGSLDAHERTLDLRSGLLERRTEWISPAGRPVRVSSTRLVSFVHRAVAAICFEVEAVEDGTQVIVQSELVANEAQPALSDDPRVAAALDNPLVAVESDVHASRALLLHRTRNSGLMMAAGMDHEVDAPGRVEQSTEAREDWARMTAVTVLAAGERLRVVKYLSYGWSGRRSQPALRDQVGAALTGARYSGWDGLVRGQRDYLDAFWDGADVEVEGDPVVQQAVRFALFHVLQAGARAERRALPAKGLTGPGYDGHAFWDTEGFVLPVLTYTVPDAAADGCAGGTRSSTWRASGPARSDWPGRPSPGAPSAARSRRRTGRPGRPPSTSTPTSPSPSSATASSPATTGSSGRPASSCWSRPPGCGCRSATTTRRAAGTSTG